MTTINYDLPVKDLIAQLDATGHVTHRSYRKTSVTIHHNAGRLSHEGVLQVWRARPASAHFDVDGSGAVAQYVRVNEYAWAVGSRLGNESTISIEMANSTLGPNWEIAPATLQNVGRLAGWLFAFIIKERPSTANLFPHYKWTSTACPGPSGRVHFGEIIAEAQKWYDNFTNSAHPSPTPPVVPAPQYKSNEVIAAEVWQGVWGSGNERKSRLLQAGYDYNEIQRLVNAGVGRGGVVNQPVRKSISQLATEVIAGQWGNGVDRTNRLRAAGYDPQAVQNEVNRRLR